MQNARQDSEDRGHGRYRRLGSHLVEILEQRGHDVVPIARSKGVDVVSGEGLDDALAGAETIIDAATGPSPDQEEATAFFTASARNLQRAGAAAGAKRIVVVSIIGIDKFQGGYNAAKVVQERTLLEGPLPVRIVRAAQFHEFVEPAGRVDDPGWRRLPARDADAARGCPRRRRSPRRRGRGAGDPERQDHRGRRPRAERLADAAAALFASRGDSVEIRESRGRWRPDPDAAAYAEGAALPNPGAKLAGPSFQEWLAAA